LRLSSVTLSLTIDRHSISLRFRLLAVKHRDAQAAIHP